MKVLIDAQLPRLAIRWFTDAGCDAVHTLDLPNGNRTTDLEIIARADAEQRVVVTKDADFVDSHALSNTPKRLLLVSTGNITNLQLRELLLPLISTIMREFQSHAFMEVGAVGLVVRE